MASATVGVHCSTMVLREDIGTKKNVFFRALPESPKPPPHDPNSGNLVLFFGRQKQRFARMTEFFLMMIMMVSMIIMMIILVILMIIMTKMTKKHTITVKFE